MRSKLAFCHFLFPILVFLLFFLLTALAFIFLYFALHIKIEINKDVLRLGAKGNRVAANVTGGYRCYTSVSAFSTRIFPVEFSSQTHTQMT